MAETTADVRREIELTRERMSNTLSELEYRLNVRQFIRDHPWSALAIAVGAGVMLSGTGADVKAARATATATRGTRGRIGSALDDMVASLVSNVSGVVQERMSGWADELRSSMSSRETARTSLPGRAD